MVNSRAFAMSFIALISADARASQKTSAPAIPAKPATFASVVEFSSSKQVSTPTPALALATSTEKKESTVASSLTASTQVASVAAAIVATVANAATTASTTAPATSTESKQAQEPAVNTASSTVSPPSLAYIELEDGLLSKIGNYFSGTDTTLITHLKALKHNEVLKPDSVTNQKVISSAVLNLLANKNPNPIIDTVILASTKKLGHIITPIDRAPRKSIRKWLKEYRNQRDQELIAFSLKQTEAYKQEYNERVKYINELSETIDRTYELGGESDNEEEHPVYVPSTDLIKTAPTELSKMAPSKSQRKNHQ